VFAVLISLSLAAPTQRRSFLATAFRAARVRRTHLGDRVSDEPAAVPVPAPAPPPPPDPFPPKFPVIGQDECSLLQEGFLVDPPAKCVHVILAENVDGCTCSTFLPGSINPQPANFYNPFLVDIPPNPDLPVPASMPTVPPPSNPMQPFIPPMMPPECPFMKKCGNPGAFECVGHDSWGFSEAHIADYSPAAAALNSMSCTYVMKPYARFKVPDKVSALWHLNAKLVKVFDRMSDPFNLFCTSTNVSYPSLQFFCKDQLQRMGLPCDAEWYKVTKQHMDKRCWDAPAPDGFVTDSTLAELCPLECGWKKGVARWPPHLTNAERAAIREKEAKEAKQKADEEGNMESE